MYFLVYGFLWLLSLLPLWFLYLISDAIYGLVFYILKYRRKVVFENLHKAFPQKTEKEIRKIAKKFYHNFVDMLVETIKMITISQRTLEKRISANWEILDQVYATGKSVQIHVGHNFNWEWGNLLLPRKTKYKVLAVYMPFTNKLTERLMLKLRTKTGTKFLRATKMQQEFYPYRNTRYMLGLIADQSPSNPKNGWWFDFMGRKTASVKGPAKAAIANDLEVIFAFIHKPRRGHYRAVFNPPVPNVKNLEEQELTRLFVTYLEEVIQQYPDMWLWSHRRWKHEWKPEYDN